MNRTDQAPDPAMQEILASIRHIISDDDRSGPLEKSAGRTPRAAPAPMPQAAQTHDSLPEDDVFELTDELVFPDEPATPSMANRDQAALAAEPEPQANEPPYFADENKAANPPPQRAENLARPINASAQRPDVTQRSAPAGSRPVWSRRELPGSPAPARPSETRSKREQAPAKPAQKNWAEDIQMPVPDQGPVSLIASEERAPRLQEAARETRESLDEAADYPGAAVAPGGGETAVAALAEKFARSAAGAMALSELASARNVDFEHLSDDRKAEVTETFANAIQRESAELRADPLPSLLDEVLRQDFIRESSLPAEPEYEATEPPTEASDSDPRFASSYARSSHPAPVPDRDRNETSSPARAAELKTKVAARQQPMEPFMPDQSRAQAQFLGAAKPSLATQGGRSLEDSVREMLRPLLLEWLNENMPRILENAIREELATRDLLPRSNE